MGPLVLEECPFDLSSNAVLPNSPTSWFWNIRLGDQVRINNVGPVFTVVGPMSQTNAELFVNFGPPGTQSPLARLFFNGNQAIVYYPDFLRNQPKAERFQPRTNTVVADYRRGFPALH